MSIRTESSAKNKTAKPRPILRKTSLAKRHRLLDVVQSEERFGLKIENVRVAIGGQTAVLSNEGWRLENDMDKIVNFECQVSESSEQNLQLKDERNLLNMKITLLLDMMADMKVRNVYKKKPSKSESTLQTESSRHSKVKDVKLHGLPKKFLKSKLALQTSPSKHTKVEEIKLHKLHAVKSPKTKPVLKS